MKMTKTMQYLVIASLILIFSAVSAFGGGQYIYIDSSVGDAGTGSQQSPYNEFIDINWEPGGEKSVADWVASGEDVHICLKRGEEWNEMFTVDTSGSQGHPVIIEPYGSGADPVIGRNGEGLCIAIDDKKYITIDGIYCINSENITFQLLASNNILIKNCSFENGKTGINIVGKNRIDAHNITIENCTFNGQTDLGVRGIVNGWGNQAGSDDGTIHTLSINNCTFEDLNSGIGFIGNKDTIISHGGISPYRVVIRNNLIRNTQKTGVALNIGLRHIGSRSYVQNNRLINIGSPDEGNVNGLQFNWCRGLTIQDNEVDTVRTNKPDGIGIILDWAWKDNNYLTDGVVIRRNTIRNCRAAGDGKGIGIWKATNSYIYNNLISNCTKGIKVTNNESTGTKSYNNTIVNCTKGVFVMETGGNTIFKNNIIYQSSEIGFHIIRATSPNLAYNCVFGSGIVNYSGVTIGNNSIEQNPLFVNAANSDFQLSIDSPCIDSGISAGFITFDILGNVVPINGTIDMGAYEFNSQGDNQIPSIVGGFRIEG